MNKIQTSIDTGGDAFKTNQDAMLSATSSSAGDSARSRAGGGEKYTNRHIERGKLLPGERVERIIDKDGWFLELCPLAAMDLDGLKPGARVIAGVGVVEGVEVMITLSEATDQGVRFTSTASKSPEDLPEIALENRPQCRSMIESAGMPICRIKPIFLYRGRGF